MAPKQLVSLGHGKNKLRGLKRVPRPSLNEGRFGRLSRRLDPAPELPAKKLRELAESMREPKGSGGKLDNPKSRPATPTSVSSSTTTSPSTGLQPAAQQRPDALVDFRSPRFDLDSVYGRAPRTSRSSTSSRAAASRDPPKNVKGEPTCHATAGRALIGDPRNDENIIVSQLQLTWLRFHNKVVDRVAGDNRCGAALRRRPRLVRWHYQWMILHDFLRVVGPELLEKRVKRQDGSRSTRGG